MKKPIAVLLIAALAAGGWYYYQQQQKSPLPDSITYSNGRHAPGRAVFRGAF